MNLSKHNLLFLSCAWLAFSQPALAAGNLNDFLANGYRIASRTEVVGGFHGCDKDRKINLKDKSAFTCSAFVQHAAYAPSAIVLQTRDIPPRFALLIDGQSYSGYFTRIAGKQLAHPAPATTVIQTAAVVTSSDRPLFATMPLMPVMPRQPIFPGPAQ